MIKPPKGKQHRLSMVVVVSVLGLGGIWIGLTQPQRSAQKMKKALILRTTQTLHTTRRAIALVETMKTDLASASLRLQGMEANLPEGDVYRWIIRTFGNLRTNKVEFAALEPPRAGPSQILPKISHGTATFSVAGTAHYHDFGIFLATLENSFPLMRLQRLELEPTHYDQVSTEEQDTIEFKLEIVTLVKSEVTEP